MKVIWNTIKVLVAIMMALGCYACHDTFLDEKPTKSLLVPRKIEDFQGLLDNYSTVMNRNPGLHIMAGDELVVEPHNLGRYQQEERDAYLWTLSTYPNNSSYHWSSPYQAIFYANVVLDGINNYGDLSLQWVELEAAARFYRAWSMYGLVDLFGDRYDALRLTELKGVPIRQDPDIEIVEARASLLDTYQQIYTDLEFAKDRLPDKVLYANRPSKAAAHALLARIYLSTEDYAKALFHAETALSFNKRLLDYNTLTPTTARPFPLWNLDTNPEIIFFSILLEQGFSMSPNTTVHTDIVANYHSDDLRKSCFLRDRGEDRYTYKGSYVGVGLMFGGLATDELYLICAETLVRLSRANEAKIYLDELLSHRYVTNRYLPLQIDDTELLLRFTLQERRKQLLLRGVRWSDLKRLNKDPRFRMSLWKEGFNGQQLQLTPDDDRYVFPIPANELDYLTK